jgi:hypothetical protein
MLVIVPSRGRPDNIKDLLITWFGVGTDATLIVAIDDDDPRRNDSESLVLSARDAFHDQVQLTIGPRLRLAGTLNAVAMSRVMRAGTMPHDIIGFMGDDHRPRTPHWDHTIEDVVKSQGTSIVYGNDLLQGPNLPTAVFMTADIIKTLGYMVPPGLVHMYLDNTWKLWGHEGLGRLYYLQSTIIEHMHPVAGKAAWDDRYIEVNAGSQYVADEAAFNAYVNGGQWATDKQKLRGLICG